jgi:Glycogen recognition site of AMP-activated protein kinase
MTERPAFSTDAHRYLDGEPAETLTPPERASADRLRQAVAAYVSGLAVPDAQLDRVVMARVLTAGEQARGRAWRWLVAPRVVRVRPAVLAAAAAAVLAVWWVSVRPSVAPVAPVAVARVPDTVLVRFELSAPQAHEVSLAGSFNRWEAPGVPLRRSSVPGLWTVTVPLPVGEQQYLFLVDGTQWIPDPTAHAQVDDGFGRRNSVIIVGPRGVARS